MLFKIENFLIVMIMLLLESAVTWHNLAYGGALSESLVMYSDERCASNSSSATDGVLTRYESIYNNTPHDWCGYLFAATGSIKFLKIQLPEKSMVRTMLFSARENSK